MTQVKKQNNRPIDLGLEKFVCFFNLYDQIDGPIFTKKKNALKNQLSKTTDKSLSGPFIFYIPKYSSQRIRKTRG